ncbi:MAG: transposase [Chloroflexi bacterium]|nr:transposase [Chloroflexota bacterium]MBP8055689.1 transposase [Chloroflexota bacterium]
MYEYDKLSQEQRNALVEERKMRGFPLHQPPHPVREQTYYLLTVACYEHQHYMTAAARRQQILDLLFEQVVLYGIQMYAWAVLTNHYHLLTRVPVFDALKVVFQRVHGRTAFEWNREENVIGRKVWYRYSDRAIRSERHYNTTLNYIHFNPVKHGLVDSPYDWAWSSVHWYETDRGRDWLRDLWRDYPVKDYGKGWDEV